MRTNEPEQQPFMPDPSAMDITDEKFKELCDMTVRMVEKVGLHGKEKSLMPVIFVHHRSIVEGGMLSDIEHTVVGIADGFNDGDKKREIVRKIGRKIWDQKLLPVAIFMASEAWMSHIDVKDKKNVDLDNLPMPSKDPNRKECLMIAGRTISYDCKIGIMIPIKRDENDYMHRDMDLEEIKTKDLDMYLLNHFFHGFFEKLVSKYSMEEMEQMAAKNRNR